MQTPSFLHSRAGPLRAGGKVSGEWVVLSDPAGAEAEPHPANHPSGSPIWRKSPLPTVGRLDLWIGAVLPADREWDIEIPDQPANRAAQ